MMDRFLDCEMGNIGDEWEKRPGNQPSKLLSWGLDAMETRTTAFFSERCRDRGGADNPRAVAD